MKKNDSTISLIKSLKPIDFSYSKQAKNYERFFFSSSLKHLLKNLNKKVKVPGKFELPILKEVSKVNNDCVNVKIKSNFNYVTELSSLKNFRVSSMTKKKITQADIDKMNLFKELFYVTKEKIVDVEFRKKRYEKIKEKYLELKASGEKESTLDPGKYHPKYDIKFKRNPIAFFGTKGLNLDNENNNDNKIKKENIKSVKLYKNSSADDLKLNENKIEKKKSIIKIKNNHGNKDKNNKINNTHNINLSFRNMNFVPLSQSQTMYNIKRYDSINGLLKIERINSFKIGKRTSTALNFHNNLTKRKLFKKSASVSDFNKIKCPILFKKMPGRDRKIEVTNDYKQVDYHPKYDFTRPHIPATIFKQSFDYKKFKKYITSKIIRSYCFTPDKYFIFEINKSLENDNNEKTAKKEQKINKDNNIINYNFNY